MPNHVTTVVTVTGPAADVDTFIARHIVKLTEGRRTGEDYFDFETVIPMPQSIKATIRDHSPGVPLVGDAQIEMRAAAMMASCRTIRHGYTHYPWIPAGVLTWNDLAAWLDEKHPTARHHAEIALRAAAETGHSDWHSWSIAAWGTKWNAYEYKERIRTPGSFVFRFESAWAVPVPVLRKLATLHPTLTFATESIDEGGWEYSGTFTASGDDWGERKDREGARYERVMGRKPYRDEDEAEEVQA